MLFNYSNETLIEIKPSDSKKLYLRRNRRLNQQNYNSSRLKSEIPFRRNNSINQTSNRVFSYRLFVDDFAYIVRKHGFRNLWRGNLMNIYRMFPHAAIVHITILRTLPLLIFCVVNFTKSKINPYAWRQSYFYVGPSQGLLLLHAQTLYSLYELDWPWKNQNLHILMGCMRFKLYTKNRVFWDSTRVTVRRALEYSYTKG